jgi:hypothetical protein
MAEETYKPLIWEVPPDEQMGPALLKLTKEYLEQIFLQPEPDYLMARVERGLWQVFTGPETPNTVCFDNFEPGLFSDLAIRHCGRICGPVDTLSISDLINEQVPGTTNSYYLNLGSFGLTIAQLQTAKELLKLNGDDVFSYDLQKQIFREVLMPVMKEQIKSEQ